MAYRIDYACASLRGALRLRNQDNLFCDGFFLPADHDGTAGLISGSAVPGVPCFFAVFDGLGGEPCGETASFLAARTLSAADPQGGEAALSAACAEANRLIVRFAEENRLSACGTTAAMLLLDAGSACWCTIGDSPLCLLHQGDLCRLSPDDLYPPVGNRKPALLQYLGIPPRRMRIAPHTGSAPACPGDTWLLCTDGLSDLLPPARIRDLVSGLPAAAAGDRLLRAAAESGAQDDVTFLLLSLR